jgi:hypothetical protein
MSDNQDNTRGEAAAEQEPSPYYGGPLGAGIDWADPNSPLARWYFSTAGVVATVLLGVALYLLSAMPLLHTDFWSHLKYGEWIVSHRTLPTVEPLCPFTDKERPFFDAMWLSQVIYCGVFRWGESLAGPPEMRRLEGGVEAIRLLHAAVGVIVLALFAWAVRQGSGSAAWGAGAVTYGLVMLLPLLVVQRPQTLAFLPFLGTLVLLRPFIGGEKTTSARVVWLFPLIMVLWANLHGSFVIGLLLAALAVVSDWLQEIWQKRWSLSAWWSQRPLRYWTLSLMISVAAIALLNPYGPQLYLHVLQFGSHPNLQTMAEWQPLEWTWGPGGHWSYLFLAAMLGLTVAITRRLLGIFPVLLLLTFGLWPLFQQRMMAWWAPLAFWILAPLWTAWARERSWSGKAGVPSFRKTALAGLIGIVAIIAAPASFWLKAGRPRPFASAVYPATPSGVARAIRGEDPGDSGRAQSLIAALKAAGLTSPQGPIFCSERLGEYLLWALPADRPVMMFNHAQLFPSEYWSRCLAVKDGEEGWEVILQHYGAVWIVVETHYHPRLCSLLRQHPDWKVLLDEEGIRELPADARLFVAVKRPK